MNSTKLHIVITLFIFSLIFPLTTNADITSGLVGHWTFDEGSGTTVGDASGNEKIGAFIPLASNGSTWTTNSKVGSGALQFDGTGKYVQISTAPTIASPYTVSFWFYPNTFGETQGLLFYGLSNPGMGIILGNRLQIASYSTGTFRTFCNKAFSNLDLNKWHHLTIIINSSTDASQWKCYINASDMGVIDSDSSGTYANPGNTNWTIGAYYNNSYWFNGKIDDVRIYNRAFSASDVTELYNNTNGVSFPDPTPTITPNPVIIPDPSPTPTPTPAPIPTNVNEMTALSCSQNDVQSAINSVISGGTVNVPSGNCTWNSAIKIGKLLTIKGNSTTLTAGATLPDGFFYITDLTGDSLMRISGFTFMNRVVDIGVQSVNIKVINNLSFRNLRIDHNIFHYGYESVLVTGSFGVIDNNYFYNARKAISFGGGSRAQADTSWNSLAVGTGDALFIENNNFITNESYPLNYTQEQIGTYNGGKLVVRYNNFNATSVPDTLETYTPFMAHGSADGGCGGAGYWQSSSCQRRGQSVIEFYNNTQSGKRIDFMYISRGSVNVIHNNTITGTVKANPRIILVEEEYDADNWSIPRIAWPAEDQVHNTFIWNNTYRGHDFNDGVYGSVESAPTNYTCTANKTPMSCCTGLGTGTCGSNSTPTTNPFLRKDRDYFLHAPCGASDITDEYGNVCTHGKATFIGLNGASNTYPTDGTIYPTLGTMIFSPEGANAYYPYVPYVYPHPLVSSIAHIPTPTPTPTPTLTTPPPSGGGGSLTPLISPAPTVTSTPTATTQTQQTPPVTPITTSKRPIITNTLSIGSKGTEVQELQAYLKDLGYLNTGRVDGNFGYLTRDAVQKYQCAVLQICSISVDSEYGSVGQKTRSKLTDTVTTIKNTTTKLNITRTLSFGTKGTDVTALQNFLISKGYLTQGNTTGYFGKLTRAAVQKFQCDKLRICSGTSSTNGYGVVGPKTRREIGK